jgi:acetyl-CoA decarbonylase/synthase, CODH/ACS complex subunit gamma
MALTGLEIYKHLPRTNCKDCGQATCLAFAMKVAGKQAGLDDCPHMTDEGRTALGDASAPPQHLVSFGTGDAAVAIGQETVLFRHEETFHHPTVVAVTVSDELDAATVAERCAAIRALTFDRVGKTISVQAIAIENVSGDAATFAATAAEVAKHLDLAALLISTSADALKAAASGPYAGKRPLLCGADAGTLDAVVAVAKDAGCPLCITDPHLEPLAELTEKAKAAGVEDLVLSPGPQSFVRTLRFLTRTRRAALKKTFRPLGYPVLVLARHDDPRQAVIQAAACTEKYAGIAVIDTVDPAHVVALLSTGQDIYTDPQKPVQVEPKLYEINSPGPESPVLVTTNFSLSYYSVEGEVESSRVPAWILAVDTEGTSVLTAWAADKFSATSIAKALKASGAEDKITSRTCVLPGYVAVLSAGVKDESGWEVTVGPKEASGISPFLKKLASV